MNEEGLNGRYNDTYTVILLYLPWLMECNKLRIGK